MTGKSAIHYQSFVGLMLTEKITLVHQETFNSKFLNEIASNNLQFSSENFSASELAAKYFTFTDIHRPLFDSDDELGDRFSYFVWGGASEGFRERE